MQLSSCWLQVVSEWSFQKDGQDVEMCDISNDTKSAQLDSRDTFLGIGQNRCPALCCEVAQGRLALSKLSLRMQVVSDLQ